MYENIAKELMNYLGALGDPFPMVEGRTYSSQEMEDYFRPIREAKKEKLRSVLQGAHVAGLREAAEIITNSYPATQDMLSTHVCDALDDIEKKINARIPLRE
jgi:hypothetical protein